MTITVIRDEKWYKTHFIDSDDAIKYGVEKASIISNVDKYPNVMKKDLYSKFPYIKKEKFEKYLKKLIEEGVLCIKGENE